MYVSYVRDIAIQQDHTILFPNATFSIYVATNSFQILLKSANITNRQKYN